MMLLELGANRITLTLNESKTLDSPDYILVFVNDLTAKKCACLLGEDLSEYPERSNEFTLTVKEDPEPLDAEVFLPNPGTHTFYVYESEDASGFNFAGVNDMKLEDISGEVEKGIMKYQVDPTEHKYYLNNRTSVKTYNG